MATKAVTLSIGTISAEPDLSLRSGNDEYIQRWGGRNLSREYGCIDFEESRLGSRFVLKMDDIWLRKIDWVQAKNVILGFEVTRQYPRTWLRPQRIEWPLTHALLEPTGFDLAPTVAQIDEETEQFVANRGLTEGIAWLQANTPHFFSEATFEIESLPKEDGEDGLLALRVFGSYSAAEFCEHRHCLCEAMLKAGHGSLYGILSIFQRRVDINGWQAFSWYRSLSEE